MKAKYFIPALIVFPVLLIQLTLVPLISIESVIPDLILITLVYFSILYGQTYGTILGSFYGLVFDLISGSLLGSSMLSKTVAGFSAGYFSSETRREKYLNTYSFALVVFLSSLIDQVIYSFFSALDFNTNILLILFEQALLPSIFTSALSILVVIIPFKRSYN